MLSSTIAGLMIMGGMLVMYFLPCIIALARGTKRVAGIIVVNFFLGWTMIGWVAALAWAVADDVHKPPS